MFICYMLLFYSQLSQIKNSQQSIYTPGKVPEFPSNNNRNQIDFYRLGKVLLSFEKQWNNEILMRKWLKWGK